MFNDKLRKKLSIEYTIPENKIFITCPERGSYKVKVILWLMNLIMILSKKNL